MHLTTYKKTPLLELKSVIKSKVVKLILLSISFLMVTGCNGGGSDDNNNDNSESIVTNEVSSEKYYEMVANTIESVDLGNDEIIVSFYNFDLSAEDGKDQLFQIGLSKDNGETFHLLLDDVTDVSSIIPNAIQANPTSVIYSDSTILLNVMYRSSTVSNSVPGTIIIDRETENLNFIPSDENSCTAYSGIEQEGGSWLLVGSCDSKASIYQVDKDLGNTTILEQLESNSFGGSFNNILIAADQCIYVGGHNWEVDDDGSATHIIIKKSCDQGLTWEDDFEYFNAGQAYTSLNQLYEINGSIQFYGLVGAYSAETGRTDVTVVVGERNTKDDWEITELPGTTVVSSSPSRFIAFEDGSCNMVSASYIDRKLNFNLSDDCGKTWSNSIETEYSSIKMLNLTDNIVTFHHYTSVYQVDSIDFNDLQSQLEVIPAE